MNETSPGIPKGQRQDATLEAILNSAVDGIITINQDGIIQTANPAAAALFQYPLEAFIGRNVNFLMPEPYRAEHDGYLHNYTTTGQRKIIGLGREVVGLRSDGTTFPMHLSVGKYETDGKVFFTGIIHDLSERTQADAMAARLGRVLEASTNEVYIFDAKTLCFLSVNSGARRNLGYSEDELAKMTAYDIKPEISKEEFFELIAPLVSGEKEKAQFETIHRRKDGTTYNVEVNLQYHKAEDPPVFVAIILDITERLQIERALQQTQKMEAVGQLTGGVAHDFNNLLTVIIGNLELLEMRTQDPSHQELIDEAQGAAGLAATLTERLLAFSRRSALELKVLDLSVHAQGLTGLLRRTLGETIKLTTEFKSDLWPTKTDPAQLESAIVNLAVNARDAMPNGGKLVLETSNVKIDEERVAFEIGLEAGDYVLLSVTDSGHGMAQDVLAKVFEPFFTTKETGQGTGLGLSMVYGFCKQSGGHVSIYSELNVGTTINLYLPRHQDETTAQSADPVEKPTSLGDNELILVVEDDIRVRQLTLARLSELGYRVLEAEDGKSAVSVLSETHDIDLVFTDMIMPGDMTGYDVCRHVRKHYPDTAVLLTSGYAEEIVNTEKLEAENVKLLRKPYRLADLSLAIKDVLAIRKV